MERDTLRCYVDEKRCVLYVLFYLYRIVCCHLYIFAFRPNRATFSLSLSLSRGARENEPREISSFRSHQQSAQTTISYHLREEKGGGDAPRSPDL